ncbi:hypothetical protein LJ707_05240 [Mucilaginibacter sp. UR6-1]|uniref:hypothetical protein n=1 Tax=Mucilaginibacter sp. UR6-1 TaxID=1435643 RepID=UPI001E4C9DE2|nr:hypothetical protein [Mucilaginibacter sp. UR6-1]MCC8408324.1 hypothetical protein [Mucilaginibacter sp. UR6-1]
MSIHRAASRLSSDAMIIIMIVILMVAQAGLKIKVTRAVLHHKNTHPCQLQK